ncbi:MAG: hypothetical protein ACLRHJ_09510 [Faecalimonas umbilicata]|uniref:hypothetical protein n=1 Tax=Faecalimonas umbilicata TaxID=1912855 RepID=UPI0039A18180
MEEKQVRTAVWEGKAQAAVILPEDFYQDIYEGNPAKVILLFPEEMDLGYSHFQRTFGGWSFDDQNSGGGSICGDGYRKSV